MGIKEEIMLAKDLPVKQVNVKDWPDVYVRTLSVAELEKLTKLDAGTKFEAAAHARICTLVLCDKDGNAIFDEDEHQLLMKKPFSALKAIVDAALEHNGLTEAAADALEGN